MRLYQKQSEKKGTGMSFHNGKWEEANLKKIFLRKK